MDDNVMTDSRARPAASFRYGALPEQSQMLEGLLKSSELEQLFESYYRLIRIPVAIIDLQANVLLSSRWQRICAQFHRVHPQTCKRCVESDNTLASQLEEGAEHTIYRCLNGLTDCASPIIINGSHIANVMIGQFLTEAPDETLFRRQAEEFAFDVDDYLAALREVPIVGKNEVPAILDLLARMTRVITNLSMARKQALDARARQSLILDTIPQSVFWKDLDGAYLGCNVPFARAAGLASPDDIVGKTDFDLPWNQAEAEAYRADDRAVVAARQPRLHIVEPLQKADGTRIMIDTSKVPLTDADGEICGVVGVYEDVSNRLELEEAVRIEAANLEAVFNASPLVMMVLDESIDIVRVNEGAIELCGCTPSEILHHRPGDALGCIHAAKAARGCGHAPECPFCPVRNGIEGLIADGGAIHGAEVPLQLFRDGRTQQVWLKVYARPVSIEGRRHVCVALDDITERRRTEDELRSSERRFQSLFASIADAIFVVDAESSRILDANPAALQLIGRSRDEVLSMHRSALFPLHLQEEAERVFEGSRQNDNRGDSVQTEVRHADGYDVPVEIRTGASFEISGQPCVIGVFRDQTERRRAEEAEREYARFQRTLLERMPVGMFVVDPVTRRIEYANSTCVALHGGDDPEDLVGHLCHDFICPAAENACPLLDLDQSVDSSEKELICIDGSRRPILKSVLRVSMQGREKLLECFVDLTRRKEAEAALREREATLAGILDNLQDAYFRADELGRLVFVNPAAPTMYGLASEEAMMGLVAEDLYADASDREALLDELRTTGRVTDFVCRGRRSDGSTFWASVNAQLLRDPHGQPVGTEGVVRNVSERKEAADALRTLTDRYREAQQMGRLGHWSFDPAAMEFRGSEVTNRIYGFPSGTAMTYDDIYGCVSEADVERVTKNLFRLVDEGTRFDEEFEIRPRGSDETRILWSIGERVFDEHGFPQVRGILQDVTERKSAERERLDLQEQLRAAQKMEAVGSLAGGVAHDFNNLLSVILCFAGFALESLPEGSPVRDDLMEVIRSGERATELTRQLLAFSRKQVLQPEPLCLNQIASGLEKMLRRILGEDIDLVLTLAPDLGVVMADPGQVEQVLMNLVVNARDAMLDGGKLTIETRNIEVAEERRPHPDALKPGPYVQVAVTDTGVGMDPQTRARIFEPFFTTKEKGRGTGLGLATVHGIVKQSGGDVRVHTQVGKGTTFEILMPRDLDATTNHVEALPMSSRATGTETILVVEDEGALRRVVARSLGKVGYKVLTAADGAEAITLCSQHDGDIHLLLTDVIMPGMNGRVLALEALRLCPRLKVIYMSGYTDEAIGHHGVLDAGTHFLIKPFTSADLTRKVRDVLDSEG